MLQRVQLTRVRSALHLRLRSLLAGMLPRLFALAAQFATSRQEERALAQISGRAQRAERRCRCNGVRCTANGATQRTSAGWRTQSPAQRCSGSPPRRGPLAVLFAVLLPPTLGPLYAQHAPRCDPPVVCCTGCHRACCKDRCDVLTIQQRRELTRSRRALCTVLPVALRYSPCAALLRFVLLHCGCADRVSRSFCSVLASSLVLSRALHSHSPTQHTSLSQLQHEPKSTSSTRVSSR